MLLYSELPSHATFVIVYKYCVYAGTVLPYTIDEFATELLVLFMMVCLEAGRVFWGEYSYDQAQNSNAV